MSETSPGFGLPLLSAGQAQKGLFHNEAILLLEALSRGTVQAIGAAAPPDDPQPGQCWIIGAAAAGAWTGRADMIACWTEGGWRYVSPSDGMTLRLAATGVPVRWQGGAWTAGTLAAERLAISGLQVIGAQQPAIADVSAGGGDAEARTTIAEILRVMRAHGLIAH